MPPIHECGITELSTAIRHGDLSAVSITSALLERIRTRDPLLNAFVHVDAEGALEAARATDLRYRAGSLIGPLDGIPVAIKDNLAVAGMPCTWGSKLFRSFVPQEDELAVSRLRAAGMVVLGKTNTPEFSLRGYTDNDLWGATGNPYAPDLTPGGSSGGSVCAVAAGFVPVALATDGGGSIRRPAGFTGLFGLKPTIGRVPRSGTGFPEISAGFEVIGVVARCPQDIRVMMKVMGEPSPLDDRSAAFVSFRDRRHVPNLRILYVAAIGDNPVDPEITTTCTAYLSTLERLGHTIIQSDFPLDLSAVNAGWDMVSNVGLANLAQRFPAFQTMAAQDFQARAAQGRSVPEADYAGYIKQITIFRRSAAELFQACDIVAMPTSAAMPWPKAVPYPAAINGRCVNGRAHAVFTGWVNAAGLPAMAIPVSGPSARLPIGLQLVASAGKDELLVDLAEDLPLSVHPAAT